jgi:hypothetical protein
MPAPYQLPSTSLSFSICSTTIGNATPAPADDLSADYLFRYNWTAQNALGIKGYGSNENSGADRIANTPSSTQVNLSGYLGINVRGDSSTIGGGFGSYYSLWDNQLTGANDTFFNLYLYLYDSTKTYQLTQDFLFNLNSSTNTGYTNIGNGVPLVHYAYWVVSFETGKMDTSNFTVDIQCSIDGGATFSSIYQLNQTWADNTIYTIAWDDPGNSSVETANPTVGYAFQVLFY